MWIRVDDTILGLKLRTFSKEAGISANEALGVLVRLWLWSMNNADEDGRLYGVDEQDLADILFIGLTKGISSMSVVDALISTGWIDRRDCLYIHNWDVWQKELYSYMRSKRKHAERQKEYRARKAQIAKNAPPGIPIEAEQVPTKEEPKKTAKIEYSTQFEEFWKLYPRKIGKGEAYKCYKARISDGWNPEDIIQSARAYADEVMKRHTEACYIKHPKTFLSSTTPFADYVRKKQVEEKQVDSDDPFASWR